MFKLLAAMYISFLTTFNILDLTIKFINKIEDKKIPDRFKYKMIVSIITSLFAGVIYIKYFAGFNCIKYFIMITILAVIAYIDAVSTNVYVFINYIFAAIGFVFMAIDVCVYKTPIGTYILGIVMCFIVSLILKVTKQAAMGDCEIFVILALFLCGYASVINIFLSFTISGIYAIPLLVLKKKKFNDTSPLCPSIAIAAATTAIFASAITEIFIF